MGKRKRDANGKVIYDRPSDLKPRISKDRNRPGRRNGSEYEKTAQKIKDEVLALEEMPEMGLRKCSQCRMVKSLGAFDIPAGTSIKTTYKCCRKCCDDQNSIKLASGETKYTMNRERVRGLRQQAYVKSTLFGSEGYEERPMAIFFAMAD